MNNGNWNFYSIAARDPKTIFSVIFYSKTIVILLYGFLIGVLIVIIRVFGGYPAAVAFAVLLLNITVPLIDFYTQPKVFGR